MKLNIGTMREMKTALLSPWLTVTLVIAVVAIGYASYINRTGAVVSAGYTSCPYKQACANGECDKKDCAKGECKGNCAGCNKTS